MAEHSALEEIVDVAQAMLCGSLSYIEGARRISALGFRAGLEKDPEVIKCVAVASETDALPVSSEVRKHWAPDALEKLQPEIDRSELWAREILEPVCRRLIARPKPF